MLKVRTFCCGFTQADYNHISQLAQCPCQSTMRVNAYLISIGINKISTTGKRHQKHLHRLYEGENPFQIQISLKWNLTKERFRGEALIPLYEAATPRKINAIPAQYYIIWYTLFIFALIFFSCFSSVYSNCLFQTIETECGIETADWVENSLHHGNDFTGSLVHLGCIALRPAKPGKYDEWVGIFI